MGLERRSVAWPALLVALASAGAVRAQGPCVRCDLIYGSTGGADGLLFELDPRTGVRRDVGAVPSFADIALTPDGRLFGLGNGGVLHEIDPCDGAAAATGIVTGRPGATGTTRPDELLTSGTLLQRVDLRAGSVDDLPSNGWCGFAAGDLALDPCSGLAWQVSRGPDCPCPAGDTLLQRIDPLTGDHLADVTCLPFPALFGLAFDSTCTLWLVDADTGSLLEVDTATGTWSVAPAPDLGGTLGFASLPCGIEGRCSAGGPYVAECEPGGTATVLLDAAGSLLPSAEPLRHEWTVSCDGDVVASASGTPAVATVPFACGAVCEVELTVSNVEGRRLACSSSLTLLDDAPPQLIGVPPDGSVECDAVPPPAPVSAVDDCDPDPVTELRETRLDGPCAGRYELERTWTALDACANTSTATQHLRVDDSTPPDVSARDEIVACLWPPNHGTLRLEAELFAPIVFEACSGPVTWRISGCRSDEPDDGLGDGRTEEDCRVDEDGDLLLRAERLGNEDGRTYSVLVVATDACGNESAPTVSGRVRVAHDRREHLECLRSAPRR